MVGGCCEQTKEVHTTATLEAEAPEQAKEHTTDLTASAACAATKPSPDSKQVPDS